MTEPVKDETHTSILVEAESLVHGQRGVDYGHPLDDFTRTANLVNVLLRDRLRFELKAEDVALFMVCVKLSRQMNRNKRDNLVDAAGYIETWSMVIDERMRREFLAATFGDIEPVIPQPRPTRTEAP